MSKLKEHLNNFNNLGFQPIVDCIHCEFFHINAVRYNFET